MGGGDYSYITPSAAATGGAGGDLDAPYLVIALDDELTAERSIAINSTNLVATDGGANSTYSINTIQNINSTASPTFAGLTLSGLTASRLTSTDSFGALTSVSALTSWIAGTGNQVTVTSDGDGTITLAGPQNLHSGASPTFSGISLASATISGLTTTRLVASDGSKNLVSVADLTSWITGTANRVTATSDDDGTITLSGPQDIHTGASPQFVAVSIGTDNGAGVAPSTGQIKGLTASGTDLAGANVILLASTGTGTGNLGYLELQAFGAKQASGVLEHSASTYLTIGHAQGAHPGTSAGALINFGGVPFEDYNTAASGTAVNWNAFMFRRPTLSALNTGVTTTYPTTVYIENSPFTGTNQTLTQPYSLFIDDGVFRTDSEIRWLNTVADDATNYERAYAKWTSDNFWIDVVKGGSGTLRGLILAVGGVSQIQMTSTGITYGNTVKINNHLYILNGNRMYIGTSGIGSIIYNTWQTNDHVTMALDTNAVAASGNFVFQHSDTITTNFGYGKQLYPVVYVHSGDGATPLEYVRLFHDQTDGHVDVGAGNFYLDVAGTAFAKMDGDIFELEDVKTITGAVTDGYSAALVLDPGYTAATAQTVTRHNYIDVQNVSVAGAGPAAVTAAAVLRFDAAFGTHLATVGATTKTTPGAVDGWVVVNGNGVLHYMPCYTSTTA